MSILHWLFEAQIDIGVSTSSGATARQHVRPARPPSVACAGGCGPGPSASSATCCCSRCSSRRLRHAQGQTLYGQAGRQVFVIIRASTAGGAGSRRAAAAARVPRPSGHAGPPTRSASPTSCVWRGPGGRRLVRLLRARRRLARSRGGSTWPTPTSSSARSSRCTPMARGWVDFWLAGSSSTSSASRSCCTRTSTRRRCSTSSTAASSSGASWCGAGSPASRRPPRRLPRRRARRLS